MKIKTKTKEYQLTARIKLPSGTPVNEQELTFFARKIFRGFMKPKLIKSNLLEYVGPVGITVFERLKNPISKYDFFFIIEQIVDNTQKLQTNSLPWNKVIWDIKNSYINEATKEIQLIYLPINTDGQSVGDVMSYIESIIYSAHPAGEHDTDFVSRFIYFLRTLSGYDPQKIEDYIKKEDRDVVNTIKKQRAPGSGFMTDKRQDYYEHYAEAGNGDEPTDLLTEDEATGLLEEATGLLEPEEDMATGLLETDYEETGLLQEDNTHYPTLHRVLTEEIISVNKPVFRLGKERSYVDYFVNNNNAVSRSHADIVTRGDAYFVIDLNSKNKTFINDKPLLPHVETEIFDGNRLKLGNEEFIFNA